MVHINIICVGKLKEKIPYVNDKINGVKRTYFRNGNISSSINYVADVESGEAKFFYEDGTIKEYERNTRDSSSSNTYREEGYSSLR